MSENREAKGRRLLAEGRLRVDVVGDPARPALVLATCRGDSGEEYRLGYRPDKARWGCTCEAKTKCSHLVALQLVVVKRGDR